MTYCSQGYQYPSSFKMIKSIQNEQPEMLMVHQNEFDRLSKKKTLDKPHTDYLKMLYNKYILNKKQTSISQPVVNSHIGMEMLQQLALT